MIPKDGLKYTGIYEEVAVKVLNRLSIQMRDLKKVHEKGIKVVYRGMNKDSVEYEIYVGKRKFPWRYDSDRLKWMVFEEIEKVLHSGQNFDIINRT